MSQNTTKTNVNALVLASLATLAAGATPAFAAVSLTTGYQVSAMEAACGAKTDTKETADKSAEGKCGEGKCGEGKCGSASDTQPAATAQPSTTEQPSTNADAASAEKATEGKCGEGKCGEGKCGSAH